jgi:hypothetical protein
MVHLLTDSTLRDILRQLHWHGGWNVSDTYGTLIIISVVSAWITGVRMRRKIRKDLGRKATNLDLTSIDTWMKVDEVEQRKKQNSPLNPD